MEESDRGMNAVVPSPGEIAIGNKLGIDATKELPGEGSTCAWFPKNSATWHTYQVLTKRADRMHGLLKTKLRFAAEQNHIWLGVSVENRRLGLSRVDLLRQAPAKIRFLSVEPLLKHLGPANL